MKKGESSVRIFSQNKALAEQKVTNSSKEYKILHPWDQPTIEDRTGTIRYFFRFL